MICWVAHRDLWPCLALLVQMHRVKPSIRDIVRCTQLFDFHLSRDNTEFFVGEVPLTDADVDPHLLRVWRALVQSIALVYYLRLDSQYLQPDGTVVDFRAKFKERFTRELRSLPQPLQAVVLGPQYVLIVWRGKRPHGMTRVQLLSNH